jgi:hypothetical protein
MKMSKEEQTHKNNLRTLLRSKLEERKIQRSSKKTKEHVLEKTLKKIGIDKEQLKKDLELVKKQGGLQVKL